MPVTTPQIALEGLTFECIIGVHPHERTTPQPLWVDVRFDWDFTAAAQTDDLTHTVDYAAVAQSIEDFATQGQFNLLETLAQRLARHLCQQFGLTRIYLRIGKPNAVPKANAAVVSLEYTVEAHP